MAKKYYWLKLNHDFFASKEIKKLRKIAGGDTHVIIYLKLQLLSLKNNGKLIFEGFEDDITEELALDIDEDEDNVKMTFLFLKKYGLVEELNENDFLLPKTVKAIGNESSSAERVRKHRENKKVEALQCNTNLLQSNNEVTHVTNSNISCNTEIEKEIEKEIEIEKRREEKRKPCNADAVDSTPNTKINFDSIKDCFNSICVSLPKVKTITDNRKKTLKTILKQDNHFDFESFFKIVEASDFLSGRNGKWSSCCFDWILAPSNKIKIIEGNYNNKEVEQKKSRGMDQMKRVYEKAKALQEQKNTQGGIN
jgi:predicted phage replisome organizer